jgi:hypothetical protein
MGNPSVRFDEGRERVGQWPVCLSIQPLLPTLQNREDSAGRLRARLIGNSWEARLHAMGTLYYGDNLEILRRYIKDETVDLVYLDPPFNSAQNYNVFFQEKDGTAA